MKVELGDEQQGAPTSARNQRAAGGFSNWLVRKGFARSLQVVSMMLLILCFLIIAAAIVIVYNSQKLPRQRSNIKWYQSIDQSGFIKSNQDTNENTTTD